MNGRNWKEDRFQGKKAPEFPCDIWNAVRFIFKYSILRELRFITLTAFPVFGNQIAHFWERTAHLFFSIVRKGGLNREKSQSKIDQDFGRNRKTVETGGYCNLSGLQKIQNLTDLKQIGLHGHGISNGWAWKHQ
ncbi:hypothetical protein DW083_02940 [Parabacteroides sp. AF48-14]|uniref:hypothetical protein n=1 Tax=Parabacteroides sp. AF48-14 TaxID=2292052 RepID=UPI000F002F48|nr:hypothetical protein [Parabacteroides sp. AF48-14]RHO74362.1 hypothetical protein DW083_02940 [Parabacteroides sp. AF48-14]